MSHSSTYSIRNAFSLIHSQHAFYSVMWCAVKLLKHTHTHTHGPQPTQLMDKRSCQGA